jgi:hypothetical protein
MAKFQKKCIPPQEPTVAESEDKAPASSALPVAAPSKGITASSMAAVVRTASRSSMGKSEPLAKTEKPQPPPPPPAKKQPAKPQPPPPPPPPPPREPQPSTSAAASRKRHDSQGMDYWDILTFSHIYFCRFIFVSLLDCRY